MFQISLLPLISNTDIDECVMEDICDEFVSCTVTKGAYQCQCTLEGGSNCISSEFRGHLWHNIIKKYLSDDILLHNSNTLIFLQDNACSSIRQDIVW